MISSIIISVSDTVFLPPPPPLPSSPPLLLSSPFNLLFTRGWLENMTRAYEDYQVSTKKYHFISFHFISFHFISFHFISFHFISFHFISLLISRRGICYIIWNVMKFIGGFLSKSVCCPLRLLCPSPSTSPFSLIKSTTY